MTTTISGNTGVSLADTNSVATAALQAGAVTGAKLSGAQTGSAPIYGCRAWCVFDGTLTGTNAPIAGGNVASVTRTAAGSYAVNFAIPMPSASYCVVITSTNAGFLAQAQTKTTNNVSLNTFNLTGTNTDSSGGCHVAIFC